MTINPQILIVEDNPQIVRLLQLQTETSGSVQPYRQQRFWKRLQLYKKFGLFSDFYGRWQCRS